MTNPVKPIRVAPVVMDYAPFPEAISPKRVLSKTASVFTALAAIVFTVLGLFGVLVACLVGEGGAAIWLLPLAFFTLAGVGIFATDRLSNMGNQRPETPST